MRKLYQRIWLTSAIALILTSSALAQERNVSGTVSDESGSAMPGVSVVIKGTTQGTATDADGRYNLRIPGDDAVLVFSFVGYAPTEVLIGSRSVVDVTMNPDIQTLTELVVTGYSVDNRRDVTGAVSTVKATDLTVVPSGNIEQQLQGRVAGVTVVTNGQPGTTSQVRVRGFGTFGDNRPLYVVDGLPVESTDFLNPDDIESTTVLKDAATASIYGARAAGGVIVYTTKKGTKGGKPMQVTFDTMFGFTHPGQGQDMMNPQDFATWTWNAVINTANANGDVPSFNHPQFGTGSTPVLPEYLLVGDLSGAQVTSVDLAAEREKYNVTNFDLPIYQVVRANHAGTDWYDEITRVAPIFRNTLGIRGSGERSRYYFGLSMQEQDGILLHQHFRRYAARINSEFDILKNLRFGENLQFTYRQTTLLLGGGGGAGVSDDENDILAAFRMPSIIPVYDVFGGYAGTRAKGFNNPRNPVANHDRQKDNRGFEGSAFGNVYLEYDPIPNLTLRTSIGGRYAATYFWNYFARQYENSENNSAVTYGEGAGFVFGWTFTNTASYKREFGEHSFDLLVGQEALDTGTGRNMNGNGLNPFSEDRDFVTLTTTTPGNTRVVNSNYFKGVRFSSYFGRLNYIYADKYLASFVIRRDGSSRFGAANRYGVFPAVSLGWRISSEPFMSGVTWIDDLKIRGGYGEMGNSQNVHPFNQYSLYATNVDNSSYPIDNASGVEGFYRSRIGNPEAKWETAVTSNIGFDGTFFDGKVDVVFDVWRKDTEDLLFAVPITVGNGWMAAAPTVNVGKMRNEGVDIQVVTRGNFTPEATFELTVNGGFLHNEIVELNPGANYLTTENPSYRGITPIRNQLGYSISAFYGYKVLGLFQSQAEIDAAPDQPGVIKTQNATDESVAQGVGRFRYEDINGDNVINDDDRTYLGSPVPKFTGGITFKVNYKGFDLETYMFASIGNKIWNQSKWFTDFYPSFAGAAISERVKDSWTPSNTGAKIPIFENVSNFSTNAQANSFYVEDGSYFRMQNITIGYNVPEATLSKLRLEKLRVYAGMNNIFTITGYEGLDPSVGGDVDTRFGIDVGNYPITRSFTFGVNLGF
jgi:TonB-linked SusC/RagA family outer membrane protein